MAVDPRIYASLNSEEADYKLRGKGLGIRDAVKSKTNVTPKSDSFGQMFFRLIIAAAPLTKFPPTNWLIKKAAMLGGTHNTKGHSIPMFIESGTGNPAEASIKALQQARGAGVQANDGQAKKAASVKTLEVNQVVVQSMEKQTLPVDLLIDAVQRATYHAVLNECLCRKIQGCTDFPQDIGCLFLGPAAKACVDRGVARKLTVEESLAHIERAVEAGLSPSAYFVEVEEYVWGWKDADMPNILEVCFCCPCCCSAVHFEHGAAGELKRLLHQGIGWSCVVDDQRCVGCGACASACPHECMSIVDGKARVHETCAGCGQCVRACASGALSVCHTGETKSRIDDYFQKLHAHL